MEVIVPGINLRPLENKERILGNKSHPLIDGAISALVEKWIGPRTVSTKVPDILEKFALKIPDGIRERTKFIGMPDVISVLNNIRNTHEDGCNEIVLTDVDGTLAYFGGAKMHQPALDALSHSGLDVIGVTNRQEWFPGTKEIKHWMANAGIPLYMGADQQNPFNPHQNVQMTNLLADLASRVKQHEGNVRISTLFDVFNLVPPTWNDIGFAGISNAVLPQFLAGELARQNLFQGGALPRIDLYGINPAIQQPFCSVTP